MSGRVKHPVTEAEELRQATREAHEAIQGLREARRETDAAAERLRREQADCVSLMADALNQAVDVGNEHLGNTAQAYADQLTAQIRELNDHVSRLLGSEDSDVLANMIISGTSRDLAKILAARLDPASGRVYVGPDDQLGLPASTWDLSTARTGPPPVSRELKRGSDL